MARFLEGDTVWVKDAKEAFLAGVVVKDGEVQIVNGEKVKPKQDDMLARQRPSKDGEERQACGEMDDLVPLNMAEVLENVVGMFHSTQSPIPGRGVNRVYSSVGPVLIAMNPFEPLPIYSAEWKNAYHSVGHDPVALRSLGPHAFLTAEEAFQSLQVNPHQAVVICGESGAGKTVTNRKMLEYLCEVAKADGDGVGTDPGQITLTSSVLESFGNASTARNDNSSRFGRLTRLYLDKAKSQIKGCGTEAYLLERSRIPGKTAKERNYHVFLMLVRGSQAAKYKLKNDCNAYEYTKNGNDIAQPNVYAESGGDAADFDELCARLKTSGFDEKDQDYIFKTVAAVLHFGNAKITGGADSSSAGDEALTTACELLGVDAKKMATALTVQTIKTRDGAVERPLAKPLAEANRDTIAKMVYARLFDFIVKHVDLSLSSEVDEASREHGKTIGLLDIFGFEDMAENGFEQLFINFTNERIQHLFNTIMFEREQEVYKKEGVELDIVAPKNIDCVQLFLDPKSSIVSLLNDQCSTGKPDSQVDGEHLVSMLNKKFEKHKYYELFGPKQVNEVLMKKGLKVKGQAATMDFKECFGIKHYAGDVMYTVREFVPKSRDALSLDIAKVLHESSVSRVSEMFASDCEEESGKKCATIGAKFRTQLKELADRLDEGGALFVRCIKSNMQKVPNLVTRSMVLEQLTLGGVVAALEVRAAGLPDRLTYAQFKEEFISLCSGKKKDIDAWDEKKVCDHVLKSYLPEAEGSRYKYGKTQLFMKAGVVNWLRRLVHFKRYILFAKVQRKFTSVRVKKVNRCWAALEKLEADAKSDDVYRYKTVQNAIAKTREKLAPVHDTLKSLEKEHSHDYAAIELALLKAHGGAIKELASVVESCAEQVEEYRGRKEKLFTEMRKLQAKATETSNDLVQRIDAMEADCAEIKPEDLAAAGIDAKAIDQFKAACKTARDKIESLKKNSLEPLLKIKELPADMDLEEGNVKHRLCPNLPDELEEVSKLVEKAEKDSEAVLRVRIEFMKALQDLEKPVQDARGELDDVNSRALKVLAKGIEADGLADKMKQTDALLNKLESIEAAARDADAYKSTAKELFDAIAAAKAGLEAGEKEKERLEKEEKERQELMDGLDGLSSAVNTAQEEFIKKREKFGGDGDEELPDTTAMCDEICNLRMKGAQMPLEELRTQVNALKDTSQATIDKLNELKNKAEEASKSRFAALKGAWQNRKSVADEGAKMGKRASLSSGTAPGANRLTVLRRLP